MNCRKGMSRSAKASKMIAQSNETRQPPATSRKSEVSIVLAYLVLREGIGSGEALWAVAKEPCILFSARP